MMKRLLITLSFLAVTAGLLAQEAYWSDRRYDDDDRSYGRRDQTRIQLALILDTSGSMDDLIDQARGQMWSMVHEILYSSDADYGEMPLLEIALYEYGSSRLNRRDDYIALHVPFTTDLDWIADELFTMTTSGRSEYHGAAVARAVNELDWSRDPRDLRLVFIAGNESFDQGPVDFRRAMAMAQSRDIIVNTIFCGDRDRGRYLGWEEGAYLGGGDYLAIDSYYRDQRHDVQFQRQMMSLNQAYNATYIPYGSYGRSRYDRLCRIDNYAYGYGQTVIINRTLVKLSPVYVYPDWDLVDAYRLGRVDLSRIPDSDLPPAMRGMTLTQRKAYLIRMQAERDRLRGEIRTVAEPRRAMAPPRGSTGPATTQGSRPATSSGNASSQPRRASEARNLDQAVSQSVRQHQARRAETPSGQRPTTQTPTVERPRSNTTYRRPEASNVTPQRQVESRQPQRQETVQTSRRTETRTSQPVESQSSGRRATVTTPASSPRSSSTSSRESSSVRTQPRQATPARSSASQQSSSSSREATRQSSPAPVRTESSQPAATPAPARSNRSATSSRSATTQSSSSSERSAGSSTENSSRPASRTPSSRR